MIFDSLVEDVISNNSHKFLSFMYINLATKAYLMHSPRYNDNQSHFHLANLVCNGLCTELKKEVKAKTAETVAALKADIDHLLGYSSGGNSNLVTNAELSAFKDEIEGMHHCLKTTMDGLNLGIRQRMNALEAAFNSLTMELNNL